VLIILRKDGGFSFIGVSDLYFTQQTVRKSSEWVTKLSAVKDAGQLIVVAGGDKTTAYVTMHEKNVNGEWEQIAATLGFIGLDGLRNANINDCYTPIGIVIIDKSFGLADDPGCQMGYTKVNEDYYWSGDVREGMITIDSLEHFGGDLDE